LQRESALADSKVDVVISGEVPGRGLLWPGLGGFGRRRITMGTLIFFPKGLGDC
jgi:hypothetical protein